MSTSIDHSTAGPSTYKERISLHIPRSLLILPPCAAILGMLIGISRGGSKARLRFLAENAHRLPTTIQGWYFYTKTRNYRILYAAGISGTRHALALGSATASFCILDESVGWMRENIFTLDPSYQLGPPGKSIRENKSKESSSSGRKGEMENFEIRRTREDLWMENGEQRMSGWRKGVVKWQDGAIAGLVLGFGVGVLYRLPRQLFMRALIMGSLLGGTTSGMRVLQDRIGAMRDQDKGEGQMLSSGSIDLQPSQILPRSPLDTNDKEGGKVGAEKKDGGWWAILGR